MAREGMDRDSSKPAITPPTDLSEATESDDRRCLACGYMLRGLGSEPRCPECGLVNIPEDFRRQVWELVDSGKWFFSGFFHPFRKRPPGWWWALDREGDVQRSWRHAIVNMLASLVIVGVIVGVADGWQVRDTTYGFYETAINQAGPPVPAGTWFHETSLIRTRESSGDVPGFRWTRQAYRPGPYSQFTTKTWIWSPSWTSAFPWAAVVAFVWLTWAFPAFVGIATQIRRGLPPFARAPRTITAAANYESHRMIYTAIVTASTLVLIFLIATRLSLGNQITFRVGGDVLAYILRMQIAATVPSLAVAFGWVGPLRSDYTRQLIQGRWHAARIILLYACFLPTAFVAASVSSIRALFLVNW